VHQEFRCISLILLLSPIIQYPEYEEDPSIDAFAPFGRSLTSDFHLAVRHVPYWNDLGFTATHYPFIDEAPGIILISNTPLQERLRVDELRAINANAPIAVLGT
jgi:hypothetical protein